MHKSTNEVLTVYEVAEELRISKSTAYELIRKAEQSGLFPVLRIGTLIRVPAEPFRQWKETGRAAVLLEKIG